MSEQYEFFFSNTPFSQFANSRFTIDGQIYTWAEQYMMSMKAIIFKDYDTLEKILNAKSPNEVKKLGRSVCNFIEAEWDKNKYKIVVDGNTAKFSQNEKLKKKLLDTGSKILVEASPYDRIWGIGFNDDTALQNKDKWGQNLLGLALMEVRTKLKKQ